MTNIQWININKNEFIKSANSRDNFIRVIWNNNFSEYTKFRKCVLNNKLQWNYMMGESFLPRYKNGLSWNDPFAENFKVQEYCLIMPAEVRDRVDSVMRIAKDFTITTAYHTTLGKRLIVDGIHRALGIESKIMQIDLFPMITLMECYGNKIDENFESDFKHLKA